MAKRYTKGSISVKCKRRGKMACVNGTESFKYNDDRFPPIEKQAFLPTSHSLLLRVEYVALQKYLGNSVIGVR